MPVRRAEKEAIKSQAGWEKKGGGVKEKMMVFPEVTQEALIVKAKRASSSCQENNLHNPAIVYSHAFTAGTTDTIWINKGD